MVISHSYVSLPEGKRTVCTQINFVLIPSTSQQKKYAIITGWGIPLVTLRWAGRFSPGNGRFAPWPSPDRIAWGLDWPFSSWQIGFSPQPCATRRPRRPRTGRRLGDGKPMDSDGGKPMETNHLGSHYHLDSTSFNIPYPFLSVMFRPDLCGPPSTPSQTNAIPSLKLSFWKLFPRWNTTRHFSNHIV